MPRLSDEFLDELRSKADIEQVISSYVNLKRAGKNLVGLCPFHNEKTPSFSVSTDKQLYHCFGCGASGNVINFIKEIENLDFYDAVKFLCDRYSIQMPTDNVDNSLSIKKQRIKEINRAAAKFFYKTLLSQEGKECLDYLLNRGITKETIQHFGLGYAPESWHSLINYMQDKGYSKQELLEAGLARKSEKNNSVNYYDNFRNRMMIPLIDTSGNVLAFSGRVLDDSKPKYINTSDTLVYKKSEQLFALNFAKNKNNGKLILAEGGMDVIALHQAGFTTAVASFGTALTQEQARLISRYADEVILIYDTDEAGQKAIQKAIKIFLQTGIKIRVPKLTGGKDPDEIIRKFGAERFKGMLEGAMNDTEYKILNEREKYDLSTSDGKLNFLQAVTDILAQLNNPIECDIYAGKLSQELDVSKDALLQQISKLKRKKSNTAAKERFNLVKKDIQGYNDKVNPERSLSIKGTKAEEEIIVTLLKSPDYLSKGEPIMADDFITEFNKRVFEIVSERINQGKSTDLFYMSQELSEQERNRLVALQAEMGNFDNDIEYYNSCIEVIKKEKERLTSAKVEEMTDEQFLNAFNKLKK
ncbi:MAG: DNA primase [Clostridiales bacterium]|nr:DNA primase [Clostridiales bacterium]